MNRDVVLTVITPVFNGAAHIEACLDNVRAQRQSAVEHLVIDGGSTDGTVEIVRRRVAADPRVRLIEGPDRGQSNAMNKGIVAARGALLGFLNVDDRYLSGAIETAIAHLTPVLEPSFLWGACEVHDHLQGSVWTQYPGRLERWRMVVGWTFEPYPVNPAAYFYHRSLHFRAGLFDEAEHFALDIEFLLRALPHIRQVITVREVLGVYDMAPGTKTFEDIQRGDNRQRLEALYRRFETQLPLADRLQVKYVRLKRRLLHAYRRRISVVD